jgi:hypothetical protein
MVSLRFLDSSQAVPVLLSLAEIASASTIHLSALPQDRAAFRGRLSLSRLLVRGCVTSLVKHNYRRRRTYISQGQLTREYKRCYIGAIRIGELAHGFQIGTVGQHMEAAIILQLYY